MPRILTSTTCHSPDLEPQFRMVVCFKVSGQGCRLARICSAVPKVFFQGCKIIKDRLLAAMRHGTKTWSIARGPGTQLVCQCAPKFFMSNNSRLPKLLSYQVLVCWLAEGQAFGVVGNL